MGNTGLLGKLPVLGDFITRRLPLVFAQTWDDWLRHALAQSRASLGDEWLDAYLTCPFWRFVLSAGICGPRPWLGVLMPSVDRVGRHYPLTLALSLQAAGEPFALASAGQAWYAEAEEVMLSALSEELDVDAFDAAVARLPDVCGGTTEGATPTRDAHAQCDWRVALPSADRLACAYPALLDRLACRFLWSTAGSPQMPPSLLVCSGLPTPQRFAALLDSRFDPCLEKER